MEEEGDACWAALVEELRRCRVKLLNERRPEMGLDEAGAGAAVAGAFEAAAAVPGDIAFSLG